MNDSRIITAPDTDLDHRFKILLVDVEWSDVEKLSQTINNLGITCSIFLYGSADTDDMWCINVHRHVYSTLINVRFSGNKELLKGYLLAHKNVWTLGSNIIGEAIHHQTHDVYSWFALQYNNYLKEENNESTTRT